jgi:hypothetical protein
MNTYKTKDGSERIIPGIGRTTNGQITTDEKIENPLFELVETEAITAADNKASAPAQAATNEQTANEEITQ